MTWVHKAGGTTGTDTRNNIFPEQIQSWAVLAKRDSTEQPGHAIPWSEQQQEHSSDLPTLLAAAASVSVPGTLEAAACTLLACRRGQCPSCSPSLEAAHHYREGDSEPVFPVACVPVCRMYPGEGHLQEEEKQGDQSQATAASRSSRTTVYHCI